MIGMRSRQYAIMALAARSLPRRAPCILPCVNAAHGEASVVRYFAPMASSSVSSSVWEGKGVQRQRVLQIILRPRCMSTGGPGQGPAEQMARAQSSKHDKSGSSRNSRQQERHQRNVEMAMYMGGLTLFTVAFTYASVPLYRIFCQKTGFAGTVKTENVKYEHRAIPVSGACSSPPLLVTPAAYPPRSPPPSRLSKEEVEKGLSVPAPFHSTAAGERERRGAIRPRSPAR